MNAEHADDGIRAFNVQPGMIDTERTLMESGAYGFGGWGRPAEVVGAVVAWVATDTRADRYRDETIEAQFLCHELGLLPSWPGPVPDRGRTCATTRSGERLRLLEHRRLVKEGPR